MRKKVAASSSLTDLPVIDGKMPNDLLTSAEFIDRAEITMHEFRTLTHRRKVLPRAQTVQGWRLYSEDDVVRLRTARTSTKKVLEGRLKPQRSIGNSQHEYTIDEWRKVLPLLHKCVALDHISLEADVHPKTLQAIAADYEIMSAAIILPKTTLDKINALPIDGVSFPLKSHDEIFKAMERAMREQKCSACYGKRPRSSHCVICTKKSIEAAIAEKVEGEVHVEDSREPSAAE